MEANQIPQTDFKDFDAGREDRNQGFKIGGESFTMRPVRPEVLLGYQDVDEKPPPELLEKRRAVLQASIQFPTVDGQQSAEATLAAMDAADLEEEFERATNANILPRLDEIVLSLIHEEGHARWKALRARENDPVTLGDIRSVVSWLLGAQSQELEDKTGRPTGPPSSSTDGRGQTGPPLTGVSSLPGPPPVRRV